jgi:hypothetical protein
MSSLVIVRCPRIRTNKNGRREICDKVVGAFKPGSAGEVYCRWCKVNIAFEVSDSSAPVALSL